jgi:hypothetical protein
MLKKETLDSIKKISIFELKKKGYLLPSVFAVSGVISWNINGNPTRKIKFELNLIENNHSPRPFLHLKYKKMTLKGRYWDIYDEKFELIKIECPFGGYRWFFKCGYGSGKYCDKKAAILYMINGRFVCRHCTGLSYDSNNENKIDRGGILGISVGKAIEDYSKLKRYYYSGKPTRKHRSYLKRTKYIRKAISMEKKRAVINTIFGV